jgi:hypothetical protein
MSGTKRLQASPERARGPVWGGPVWGGPVRHGGVWRGGVRRGGVRRGGMIATLAIAGLAPGAAHAYTAAGDRTFAATLVLPQIAPIDGFWGTPSTLPTTNGRTTEFTGTFSKLITERFGFRLEDGFVRQGRVNGAQNLDIQIQYEAILDPDHEFVMSFSLDHEFGGSGSVNVGNPAQSATQPAMTFGKGFGDLPIGALRPLAITGFVGYQVAQGQGVRPNQLNAGLSLQYSLPYLSSKVSNTGLPSFLSGLTPMIEAFLTAPVGRKYNSSQTLVVAPGISYTRGSGWEVGIEAQIPTNRATGTGWGVIAQVVIQFDYLMPDSILGRPLFPAR